MSLERRLQHAARELREVAVEPPPPPGRRAPADPSRRPLSVLTAVAVPVLFVLSGVLVAVGAVGRIDPAPPPPPTEVAPTTPAADDDANSIDHAPAVAFTAARPTPALVEVGLIASIVASYERAAPASPSPAGAPVTVPGPVSLV